MTPINTWHPIDGKWTHIVQTEDEPGQIQFYTDGVRCLPKPATATEIIEAEREIKEWQEKKSTYTSNQLKVAWIAYTTDKVMRILKDGKWHSVPPQKPGTSINGATEAKVLTYDKFMSFPTFLEKRYD